MIILAFETSDQAGTVAVFNRDTTLSQVALDSGHRSAQTLAPAIREALQKAGLDARQVQLLATTIGPGSFTGLRVAAATAKAFTYAAQCHCVGLDTLDVIAHQAAWQYTPAGEHELHAVLDAQRQELCLGRYRMTPAGLVRQAVNTIVPNEQWLMTLSRGVVVTGPGIGALADRLPKGVVAVEEVLRQPQATTVGRLAWHAYQTGRRDDLWKLAPVYMRPSAAEEKATRAAEGKTISPPRTV